MTTSQYQKISFGDLDRSEASFESDCAQRSYALPQRVITSLRTGPRSRLSCRHCSLPPPQAILLSLALSDYCTCRRAKLDMGFPQQFHHDRISILPFSWSCSRSRCSAELVLRQPFRIFNHEHGYSLYISTSLLHSLVVFLG